MHIIFWLVAVALVLYGLFVLFVRKQPPLGIALVVIGLLVGLLVGAGDISISNR